MSVGARVVHELPGRTRLRVDERRGDAAYFAEAASRLERCAGVTRVEGNYHTGSLLIRHSVPFAEVAAFADRHQMFTLQTDSFQNSTILQKASCNVARIDAGVVGISRGELDLRSILLAGLLVMSAVQIVRGQIMVPAVTLLWYCLELLIRTDGGPAV